MAKPQKTALISVYDKTGIEKFAGDLSELGWKIISSGGTKAYLEEAGVPVQDVAEITGMPPILSHRVLTLHPKIHGGLLALDTKEHRVELEKYGIPWIDLVCVDLYPLEQETKNPNATRESVIDKTDIGGPTMLRAAAKGRRITICDPADRETVIKWLRDGETNENKREEFLNSLAAKAEAMISRYGAISAAYHSRGHYRNILGEQKLLCAYGENAWQKPAALYENMDHGGEDELAISNWQLVAGSPMSYNNVCDLDRMVQTVTHIGAGMEKNTGSVPYVALGVKHGNACGAGMAKNETEAIERMLAGDLRAIFGGSVMLNFPVDEKIAEELIHKYAGDNRRLLDIVAAPSFSKEAIDILSRKKGKCRLLQNPAISKAGAGTLDNAERFRYVRGGFLIQPNYTFVPNFKDVVFENESEKKDVVLAWAVGSTSNSNTITLVKGGRLVGNGVGQQDRVGAAKLAIFRADEAARALPDAFVQSLGPSLRSATPSQKHSGAADLENAVAYSDSFFPFPDAPAVLIERGIKTIFSTSGSVNDDKIRGLCKEKGVNLIMLPDTDARGFYQH